MKLSYPKQCAANIFDSSAAMFVVLLCLAAGCDNSTAVQESDSGMATSLTAEDASALPNASTTNDDSESESAATAVEENKSGSAPESPATDEPAYTKKKKLTPADHNALI